MGVSLIPMRLNNGSSVPSFWKPFLNSRGEPRLVTLGASLTSLQTTLPPLVNAYMDKYPTAELKLITGRTHEIVSSVSEGKSDVGLIASSIQEPGLRCISLFEDQLRLVVSEQHPLNLSSKLTMDNLSRLPMILFSRGPGTGA